MTLATGVGSLPGDDQRDFDEAVRLVLGELPDLPHLPEVPGRGPHAGMIGRSLAVVPDVGVDLQPAGWRLTDASGVDHRRARSLLAQDLDKLEELGQEHRGRFKLQLTGPWTLAATVEKPRGDKVLADFGARRDLAQALAEGVRIHVADVRRRLPHATLVVQVDEPALTAVLAGSVPTASGFHRHRHVDVPEVSQALEWVLDAASESGAEPWVHACVADVPWDVLRRIEAVEGLSMDLSVLTARDHDQAAEALAAGLTVALGVVPSMDPGAAPTDSEVTESVLRWLDLLGLDPGEVGDRLVLTPSCGLAGASPSWTSQALTLLRTSAAQVSA